MKALGFNFTKNDFRYCGLSDDNNPPEIIEKDKIILPDYSVVDLMEWFETELTLIIDRIQPDVISHKVSNQLKTIDQIQQSCYPQAILNLIAKKKGLNINSYTPQGINATKFGQPKKTDVYKHIDPIIGVHKPYWDKATKDAVLVAWFNLM
ncbi:MAG: hypothetical protein LAT51_13455 [Flavobacteriaceae bacterium]|nr:hypothetical protein [Flavobacteriaceae bacterium]